MVFEAEYIKHKQCWRDGSHYCGKWIKIYEQFTEGSISFFLSLTLVILVLRASLQYAS